MKQVEDYKAIRKAITQPVPTPCQLKQARPAPVFGPYKMIIDQILEESDQQQHKQCYTAHRTR